MATPNYAYAKRQRDLAKKKKKEEKRQKKAENSVDQPEREGVPPAAEEVSGDDSS